MTPFIRLLALLLALFAPAAAHADDYIASTVAGGAAGQRSAAILWNPPGSGVDLLLDSVSFTHSFTGGDSGGDMYVVTTQLGSLAMLGKNKDLGATAGAGEIRWLNYNEYSPPWGTDRPVMEYWSAKFRDQIYPISPPLRIPPGKGVAVASAHNQVWLPITFQYRTEAGSP